MIAAHAANAATSASKAVQPLRGTDLMLEPRPLRVLSFRARRTPYRRAAVAHPAIYPRELPAESTSDHAVRSMTRPRCLRSLCVQLLDQGPTGLATLFQLHGNNKPDCCS